MTVPADAIERFAADLAALSPPAGKLGIAVSGGADSLALLLLAHQAFPQQLRAASVDHGLRPESADEVATVAAQCERLGIPHDTLTIEWTEPPTSNIQALAREARYDALGQWAVRHEVAAVLTAHHADDQAETFLMRAARGSGLSGLAGVRARTPLVADRPNQVWRLRPLLGWRRSELAAVVAQAGLTPVDDPSNRESRFDRVKFRDLLARCEELDPVRLAATAAHLADAEEALAEIVATLAHDRIAASGQQLRVDATDLPREVQRRLLVTALAMAGERAPRGPDVDRALTTLLGGGTATLGATKLIGGAPWRLEPVPPRRRHC